MGLSSLFGLEFQHVKILELSRVLKGWTGAWENKDFFLPASLPPWPHLICFTWDASLRGERKGSAMRANVEILASEIIADRELISQCPLGLASSAVLNPAH